ncbi:hypothetical protein OV203_08840 [Nannocystis sp. ILAH1]|uniref:hypothetical protein n=1 Tax=Nannocystis sp. ILAH1 TaxID=2996789 RepID=UPI00226FFE9F|nr:hypothetical protein [Nannocystis sp. ILAH1]MCY0987227.1 hypothetical protein [Nannocystis sp. ILAH1]
MILSPLLLAGCGADDSDERREADVLDVTGMSALAAVEVDRIAGDLLPEPVTLLVETDDALTHSRDDDIALEIPKDPGRPIALRDPTGRAMFSLHLPEAIAAGPGAAAAPGRVVYRGAAPDTSALVQVNQTEAIASFSVLTIIDGPAAPDAFTFTLEVPEGITLELLASGAIELRESTSDATTADDTALAVIDPPWARDAEGQAVPARYTLDGHELTLHVDHHGASYPVIADPAVTTNCGFASCSIYWSRVTTKEIFNHMDSMGPGGALAAFGCPHAPSGADRVACLAVAVGGAASPISLVALGHIIANAAINNKCLKITRTRGAGVPTYVSTNNGKYCHDCSVQGNGDRGLALLMLGGLLYMRKRRRCS